MSKVYKIEIEETSQKVVEIEANSLDEAIDIAQNRYSNQEYILDDEDYETYKGVEFREYKDEVIKEKKHKERER